MSLYINSASKYGNGYLSKSILHIVSHAYNELPIELSLREYYNSLLMEGAMSCGGNCSGSEFFKHPLESLALSLLSQCAASQMKQRSQRI